MRTCTFVGVTLALALPSVSVAQTTITWSGGAGGGTAWATTGNWAGGVVPGSSSNTANNDIAEFAAAGTSTTIQMNFGTLGTPFYLGTLNILSTHTVVRTMGSNATAAGVVQFNGTGANNLILSNASTNLLTLAPRAGGTGSGVMTLRLNATNSTVNPSGTGGITISTSIAENGIGKGMTKIGSGLLVLSGDNTYSGATDIQAGELRVSGTTGSNTGTGNVTVQSGGTLSGTGRALPGAGNLLSVLTGGTVRGDSGNGTGTMTVGNTAIQSGGTLFTNLGTSSSSQLAVGANTLDLKTGSVLKLDDLGGFTASSYGTFTVATLTNGDNLLVDATATSDGQIVGEYLAGTGNVNGRAVTVNVDSLTTLTTGDRLTLRRSGNNLVLAFTPVPEPASLLAVCGLVVGGVLAVRKLRRTGQPADVTPAA